MPELENGDRIERVLWNDFEDAVKEKNVALAEFNAVIGDTPSGLPHPDGVERIKSCSRRYSAARQHMICALERLNSFRNSGIVPDDLKKKPPEGESPIADEPKTGAGGTPKPKPFQL